MKTDLQLIEEVRAGNRSAFSEIVRRYQRNLLRLALRFVKDLEMAEDVVQETFLKVHQKLHTFEGRSSFKSWLYQVSVNTAKNKLRSIKYNLVSLSDVRLSVGAEAEDDMAHAGIRQILQGEIENLPFKQRTAVTLRIFEDLSFSEIAEIMQCPYDTAKANYRHGLLKLRHKFESDQELKEWALIGQDNNKIEFNGYLMEADS